MLLRFWLGYGPLSMLFSRAMGKSESRDAGRPVQEPNVLKEGPLGTGTSSAPSRPRTPPTGAEPAKARLLAPYDSCRRCRAGVACRVWSPLARRMGVWASESGRGGEGAGL